MCALLGEHLDQGSMGQLVPVQGRLHTSKCVLLGWKVMTEASQNLIEASITLERVP